MMKYIKKLNWFGFSAMLILGVLGALSNPKIDSFETFLIVIPFSIVFAIFFLIVGRKR